MKKVLVHRNVKGSLPSTVGAILESTLHSEFTDTADTLYALGYLNQDQRIALSNAIGNSLASLGKEAGDLFNILVQPSDVEMIVCDDDEEDTSVSPDMQDTSGVGMDMGGGSGMDMSGGMGMMSDKGQSKFGGVSRSKLKDSDFLFPKERAFPIKTPQDVADAVSSWGRASNIKQKYSFDEFKKRLTAKANALGKEFAARLPEKWSEKKAESAQDLLAMWLTSGSKSLYDANKSDHIWVGVSHNSWQDRKADTIPLALIENDIAIQKSLIQRGKLSQFGFGLWQDHDETKVLGDCMLREIVPGGRSCFEMGNLKADAIRPGMDGSTMSIGYYYALKGGEYGWIVVYERSQLANTKAINARTFFNVHRRQLLSDAAMQKSVEELLAAAMEE